MGCPIRIFADIRLLTPPRNFSQLSHVLLRLLVPRHPPYALSNLTKNLLLMSILTSNRKVYKFIQELTINAICFSNVKKQFVRTGHYFRGA